MNTCFLCRHILIPHVPVLCNNACLKRAFEAIQYSNYKGQPPNVADYGIRLFEQLKVCLLEEQYKAEQPTISLTNSIEIAIVQVCTKYGLCPNTWTFAEYSNMGAEKHSYHEYDLIVLTHDGIEWKYLWHSDCKGEREPYSDALLIRRIEQYRSGASTVL